MLSVSSETENASEMPNLPASGEPTGMPQGSGAPHAGHGGEAGTAPTGKTLVIAEKRSVGRTLAAFLGCHADRGGWIEGERCDVTWAQGHLLRMLMPDEYEEHPEWRERDVHALPIVPDADGWRWRVSAERGADAQYAVLAQLVGSGPLRARRQRLRPRPRGPVHRRPGASVHGVHAARRAPVVLLA